MISNLIALGSRLAKSKACLFLLLLALALLSSAFPFVYETGRAETSPQQSGGVSTSTEVASGLQRVILTTKKARIFVNLPEHLAAGETYSGTVFGEALGATDAERAAANDELRKYVVEVAGQKILATGGRFKLSISAANLKDVGEVILRDQKGKEIIRTRFKISSQALPRGRDFRLPIAQIGEMIQVGCACDGNIAETDYIKVGGQQILPIAESSYARWAFNTNPVKGATEIEMSEGGQVVKGKLNILAIKVTAENTNLLKGERTKATFEVSGLEGLSEPVPLRLENKTPDVLTMEPSNVQELTIKPGEVRLGGKYTTERMFTGIRVGNFRIVGTVLQKGEDSSVSGNQFDRRSSIPSRPGITMSPEIGSLIQEPRPTFRWQFNVPSGVKRVVYTVKVVEILPEQGFEEALRRNVAVFERRDLVENSYQFPERSGSLVPEKLYAFVVTAQDSTGAEIGNRGISLFSFLKWPTWNLCFLIPNAPVDYCLGQSTGLNVAFAFVLGGSGSFSWTLTPQNSADQPVSGTSNLITIPGNLLPTTPGPHTYTLVATKGTWCHPPPMTITINAHPQATGGQAEVSGAIHYWDPPIWQPAIDVCCGTAWKLRLNPSVPVVGNVQWQQNIGGVWTNIPGATGASVNVNADPALCLLPQPIQYRAVVSSTNPMCDYTSNPVAVNIHQPAQPGNLTASPGAICNDGSSASQINLTGAVGTVTWSMQSPCGSGTWVSFTPSGVPFSTGPLTDTTCYKATVQSGPPGPYACPTVESITTVVVEQKPVAGVITATPAILCPGDDSVLTLSGSSGVVQWYASTNFATVFSNPISGAKGNTTQNTNILNQTTYYGVQVSSPNGVCPAVQSAIVPVTVKPNPGPIAISAPAYICPFGTATVNVTSGGGSGTYHWYCDGAPCGTNSPSLTITEPGNYQVAYDEGCASVESNVVTVKPDLLTVKITGPCCPCKGKKIQLCAVATNGVGPYTYQWSNGGTTACITIIATTTTTYTVTVTDANGCAVSKSFTITVCQ